MNLRVHEFVGDDINALTFRTNHDASAAANELCTAVGIELKRAKPVWAAKKHKYRFRFNFAKGTFYSCSGVTSELNVALLIDLRFAFSERTVGEFMQISNANEKAGRWPRKSKGKCGG